MAEVPESTEDDVKDLGDARRTRAPSKKKFDDEMDALVNNIRKQEEELEALKAGGPVSVSEALKDSRAEVKVMHERRKKIDADLEKLNKEITAMMNNISRLESTLHYRSESKIDDAIGRLEWSLKAQNFSLSQEKKIVAEIDSMRRSKKTLMQYLSMKKDKDAMRDRQRRMRQERDHYFHAASKIKQKEEKFKSDNTARKSRIEHLKKELDTLHEAKRQMVSVYKKQRDDFKDDRKKSRHESFKKRQEEKMAFQTMAWQEREDLDDQKLAHQDEICLCNTLIIYLQRYISNTDLDASLPGVTVTPATLTLTSPSEETALSLSASSAMGPVEELEDGCKLLKKSDDDYVSCSEKHTQRKQRRSRKASMVKRITHTPEVLAQFLQLNLSAPATMAEILAALEQLRARKMFFEREAEVRSEAELSVTESSQLDVSRQASHTESSDGLCESRPNEQVMEQLLQLSVSSDEASRPDLGSPRSSPQGQTTSLHGSGSFSQSFASRVAAGPASPRGRGDLASPRGRGDFASPQGPSRNLLMVAGDQVEADFLLSPLDDDFPALPSSSDSDLAQSRSRSDGSDSTPRSSSTVEGQDDLEPEPSSSVHSRRSSSGKSVTSAADCAASGGEVNGDVFYAKNKWDTKSDVKETSAANSPAGEEAERLAKKSTEKTRRKSADSAKGSANKARDVQDSNCIQRVGSGSNLAAQPNQKAWKDRGGSVPAVVSAIPEATSASSIAEDFSGLKPRSGGDGGVLEASAGGVGSKTGVLGSNTGVVTGVIGSNTGGITSVLGSNTGVLASSSGSVSLEDFPVLGSTGGNGFKHSAVLMDSGNSAKGEGGVTNIRSESTAL